MLGFGGQDIVADGFGLFGLVQIAIERSLGERLFNAALRNHFQRMFHGSLQAAAGSRSTEIIFKQILERPLSVLQRRGWPRLYARSVDRPQHISGQYGACYRAAVT